MIDQIDSSLQQANKFIIKFCVKKWQIQILNQIHSWKKNYNTEKKAMVILSVLVFKEEA